MSSFAEASKEELICVEDEKEKDEDDEYDNKDGDEQGEGEEDFVQAEVASLQPATRALHPGKYYWTCCEDFTIDNDHSLSQYFYHPFSSLSTWPDMTQL